VAEPDLKPVYLLTGSDRPKIETAVHRLRRHFAAESVETVSAVETSGGEAVALCNAGSLFGDRRLVVVDRIDGLKRDDGRRGSGWKKADLDTVLAYLESPAPGTVLALVAEEIARSSPLGKACAKVGDILEYAAPRRGLTGWVAERFRQLGVSAEPDACAALVNLVGENPQALAGEIEKIATWADGEPVGEREVEALVAATADTPTFALTDAWGARDSARMLEACEAILERSDRPRRDETARVVGALGSHLGRMRQLKRLAGEGVGAREAAGRLRMHPFYAEKVSKQAEGFADEELRDAIVRLAELDLALKGKSRLSPELELQRALIDLGRR
jgi:DNA polymerase-3 subunit delta